MSKIEGIYRMAEGKKIHKVSYNYRPVVLVWIIETNNRLFGKMTTLQIQSGRAMHRPLLTGGFLAIHRLLLAESFKVIHRLLLRKDQGAQIGRPTSTTKCIQGGKSKGVYVGTQRSEKNTVQSQNKERASIFQNGQIQDKGKIKTSPDTT